MVTGYFEKNSPGLKMPKPDGGPGQTGIRSDGAVMNGQMSTKDAFCGETRLLLQQQLRQWGPRVDPIRDPIIRFHLRLDEPR